MKNSLVSLMISGYSLVAWADFGHPNLINGREALVGEFPEVVYITTGGARCTATLIGAKVLLTAAHCGRSGDTTSFQIGQTVYSATLTRSPVYQEGNASADHDIAVGLIENEISGVKFASVGGEAKVGTEITLAGYGCTTSSGTGGNDGVLRIGENKVSSFNGFDMVSNLQGGGALCFGDSGGPAFVKLGNTMVEHHVVLGVNSKGNIKDTNYNARTDTTESQEFFAEFAQQNSVEICGVNKDCAAGGGGGGGSGSDCAEAMHGADNARTLLNIRMDELKSCIVD
jgi:hypothetical protein